MKLPYCENAVVPEKKLTEYLLSKTHPVGKSKAKFFRSLGFSEANTDKLKNTLLAIASKNEVESTKTVPFGVNYVIPGEIQLTGGKKVIIKTVWFIEVGKDKPRFVTAVPV